MCERPVHFDNRTLDLRVVDSVEADGAWTITDDGVTVLLSERSGAEKC